MVEDENVCAYWVLYKNIMHFSRKKKIIPVKNYLFQISLFQKLDTCSRGGAVRVAKEVPYRSKKQYIYKQYIGY